MLTLDNKITLNKDTINSPNLCEYFTKDDLTRIGSECYEGYLRDEQSRAVWLKRNEAGMDLALQVYKDKNFPWPGCANVAFPLVTIAAMQFHARAYPAIVNGDDVVKCAVLGPDPDGSKLAHANRVSTHMSWQLIYQDKTWEEQEDKAIFNLSIVGTNFKKTYFSAHHGHNLSELVLAKDLVLDYWSKSVECSPRKTHKIPKFRNEVYENVRRGIWCDILEEQWYTTMPPSRTGQAQTRQDNRQGVVPSRPDETTSLMFLEQHCELDLDDDGYAEPYIITLEAASKCVVRIVARFDNEEAIERVAAGKHKGKIIKIKATEYFTKKTFIPSPDGGIYDIGFGVFLGPLNEAVNSLVNMLLDAGTMQTTGGGFLGRGAKIRGGVSTVAPFEWKRVDSTGDDLRKSIYPLPVNAPSDVLFQLLSLLINYASRVSGTTDITVGENPGQNTPAQTTQTMVEMGQKIYTAIFKRIWRSSKEEFQKLFLLNSVYLSLDVPQVGGATREDYLGSADQITPVADPNITSDSMRLQLATQVKVAAQTTPGYNKDEVEKRYLKALRVDGMETLFPGTAGTPPPKDPKLVIEETKIAGRLKEQEAELAARQQEFVITLQEERIMNNAKIMELQAKAQNESANAQTEQAYAQVAIMNAEISRVRSQNESLNTRIEHFLAALKIKSDHHIGIRGLATGQEGKKAA
jgi:chaperonin GroES